MKTPITVLDGEVFRRNAMYLAISGAGNQHGKFNSFTPYYIACLAGFTTSFVILFLRKKQNTHKNGLLLSVLADAYIKCL